MGLNRIRRLLHWGIRPNKRRWFTPCFRNLPVVRQLLSPQLRSWAQHWALLPTTLLRLLLATSRHTTDLRIRPPRSALSLRREYTTSAVLIKLEGSCLHRERSNTCPNWHLVRTSPQQAFPNTTTYTRTKGYSRGTLQCRGALHQRCIRSSAPRRHCSLPIRTAPYKRQWSRFPNRRCIQQTDQLLRAVS